MHFFFCADEGSLEPRHETWSVANQHCTEMTTCDLTERRNLFTLLDLCVSSMTQGCSWWAQDRDTHIQKTMEIIKDFIEKKLQQQR